MGKHDSAPSNRTQKAHSNTSRAPKYQRRIYRWANENCGLGSSLDLVEARPSPRLEREKPVSHSHNLSFLKIAPISITQVETTMWRSKLGKEYNKAEIERNEGKLHAKLNELRHLPENRICADCGSNGTVWASVNLGVFLCFRCASVHRGIGTHISLPKGCTGTYLWGPDEIGNMKAMGNRKAKEIYGTGDGIRPSLEASEADWKQFIINKYEKRLFAPKKEAELSSAHQCPRESENDAPRTSMQLQLMHGEQELLFDEEEPLSSAGAQSILASLRPKKNKSEAMEQHKATVEEQLETISVHNDESPSEVSPESVDFFAMFGV